MDRIPPAQKNLLRDKVPAALRDMDHWLLWRSEVKNGKTTKVPYCKNGGGLRLASSTNPETWTTFSNAIDDAKASKMDGIGFAIQDTGIVFKDLDHVRNKTTGMIEPWALRIVKEVNSYTEISPSGEGLHIFPKAKLPEKGKVKDFPGGGRLEMYGAGRYATVTGDHLGGTPLEVEERDAAVSAVYLEYFGIPPKHTLVTYTERLDLKKWLDQYQIPILGEKRINGGTLFLIPCEGSHEGYDPSDGKGYAIQFDDGGGLFAGCLHDTCSFSNKAGNHWHELRERHKPRREWTGRPGNSANDASVGESSRGNANDSPTPETAIGDQPPWPDSLIPAAFHGHAGDFVRAVQPYSEADPAGLLSQVLGGFGNAVGNQDGRGPYFPVGEEKHFANEFVVLVGPTGKGRKGSSLAPVKRVLTEADPVWASRVMTGLSSGEGIVHQIRDACGDDPGEVDKRLLVVQPEFASILAMMARQGNTLSAVLREGFDSGRLGTLTKKAMEICLHPHISIIAHSTDEELRRNLDRTELCNGFANRYMFICVRRYQLLPDGAAMPNEVRRRLVGTFDEALRFARKVTEMSRDKEARELWHQVYPQLSEGRAGLLGAIIGRAEAHVLRLSCLYALLDSSKTVGVDHLRAALALWKYAESSAVYIFGEATGDPVADAILSALRNNPDGLARTAISGLFTRNQSKARIDIALSSLQTQGKAYMEKRTSEGRSAEVWFYRFAK